MAGAEESRGSVSGFGTRKSHGGTPWPCKGYKMMSYPLGGIQKILVVRKTVSVSHPVQRPHSLSTSRNPGHSPAIPYTPAIPAFRIKHGHMTGGSIGTDHMLQSHIRMGIRNVAESRVFTFFATQYKRDRFMRQSIIAQPGRSLFHALMYWPAKLNRPARKLAAVSPRLLPSASPVNLYFNTAVGKY